jgi:hypothetical protein
MHIDWQTIATLAIGLMAAIYLARRWWPGFARLFRPVAAEQAQTAAPRVISACGTTTLPSKGASGCGNGCGQCGPQTTPTKDHRVHWAK